MSFNIDKTKIKRGMVIHTPTFEQMEAIFNYIIRQTINQKGIYKQYGKDTCIEFKTYNEWSYSSLSHYKSLNFPVTPFEDILVKSDIKDYAISIKDSSQQERIRLADALKSAGEKMFDRKSLTDKECSYSYYTHSDSFWRRTRHPDCREVLSITEAIHKLTGTKPAQEPPMSKYKIGDTFLNTKGSICTICSIVNFETYNYKAKDGKTYSTTSTNIDKCWIKVDTSKVGDDEKLSCISTNLAYGLDTKASAPETSDTITPAAIAATVVQHEPIQPIITIKDKPMAKSLKENVSTQISENKDAVVNAAELKAGQLINKQAIKLVKPQLPMMVRGFADHPAASVVLANVIGLALKQYAPTNPKLQKVSTLMLNAAAFDTIDSFNIDEMVENLVSGIKLPAGVSLDDE